MTSGIPLCEPGSLDPLRLVALDEATERLGVAPVALRTNALKDAPPVGPTQFVMITEELAIYPVVDSVPVLLEPERLGRPADMRTFDLEHAAFHEAYLEMNFYNQIASSRMAVITESEDYRELTKIATFEESHQEFPRPPQRWIDAPHDGTAQLDAYQAIAPLAGKHAVQAGGKGLHALKFLMAGASQATLLTPMVGEAMFGMALAAEFGFEDRFQAIVSVAERMPFTSASVDAVFAGGCAHHFTMDLAMPEVHRILASNGVFVAVEPYRAPLYNIGTRVFGKREPNAFCSPMSDDRIRPMFEAFSSSEVNHHGTFFRYPLIVASKLGLNLPISTLMKIYKLDNWLADKTATRRHGSSIALIGRR